jgi:hypothetical protein
MALQCFVEPWTLLQFRNLFYTDGRTPWTSDSPSQGCYLHTRQHEHRKNALTDIHDLIGIQIHDSSFRATEDSSCLRLRGHCDRRCYCRNLQIFIALGPHDCKSGPERAASNDVMFVSGVTLVDCAVLSPLTWQMQVNYGPINRAFHMKCGLLDKMGF